MTATPAVIEEGQAPAAGVRRRRWPWLVLLLALLLGGGGGAAWWFLTEVPAESAEPVDGDIVALEPLTTTLGEEHLRHARVALGVVLAEGEDPEIVHPKVPLLKDALLREVAAMSADDLRSPEGSERLREALTDHADEIWGEEVVRRVVLTELMVQ